MPRLVYIVTHAVSARILLRGQLAQMRAWGFDVILITSPGPDVEIIRKREQIEVLEIDMERSVAPWRDAVTLGRLTAALRRLRPAIVNASTTKAGLLGMIAARATQVPVRIYLLRGLRLETATGPLRVVLAATERIAAGCAQEIVCVSHSLAERFVAGGYAPARKVRVLATGSSNGIDPDRFAPTPALRSRAAELRAGLGIPADAPVIGFVGRLVADKGIRELLDAFEVIRAKQPNCRLVLVGDTLAGDAIADTLARRIRADPKVVLVGQSAEPAPYYVMMDVLAFPSHREGLPNVPLEAAAASIPIVGFRSTGVVDAIADGLTGVLVPPGDTQALARGLITYLEDRELARRHGAAGSARVREIFSHQQVWQAWADEYRRLLDKPFGRPT